MHWRQGACPAWGQALCQVALVQALSGLTGVKASIPVAVVAWWALLDEASCPLALGPGGEWLATWWACLLFTAALVVEVVADCVPALDSVLDTVMLFVKPVVAFIIATAPYYDSTWALCSMQMAGPALGLAMAVAKALYTVALDAGSCGCCAPLRSAAESMSVVFFVLLVLLSAVVSMLVALACVAVAVYALRKYRQRRTGARECAPPSSEVPAAPAAPVIARVVQPQPGDTNNVVAEV